MFERYSKLRYFEDQDDLSADEAEELDDLKKQLGGLNAKAEEHYQKEAYGTGVEGEAQHEEVVQQAAIAQQVVTPHRGNYDRRTGAWGYDSPEAELFRQRMLRVKKTLRENGFTEFADHLEAYLSSTGANWNYHPPEGMDWTLKN
jgi:hypothetical protein